MLLSPLSKAFYSKFNSVRPLKNFGVIVHFNYFWSFRVFSGWTASRRLPGSCPTIQTLCKHLFFSSLVVFQGRVKVAPSLRARTDYANRACNVMLVAKLVPRTADEPSTQRTAILCPLMIDCTLFYRHRDECLHFITFVISLILEE
jgi:hypothetical protein